ERRPSGPAHVDADVEAFALLDAEREVTVGRIEELIQPGGLGSRAPARSQLDLPIRAVEQIRGRKTIRVERAEAAVVVGAYCPRQRKRLRGRHYELAEQTVGVDSRHEAAGEAGQLIRRFLLEIDAAGERYEIRRVE